MFLLDTMVVSEDIKARPAAKMQNWLRSIAPEHQFASVITMGEIRFGISRLPAGASQQRLEHWFTGLISFFNGRFLDVDFAAAQRWGRLRQHAGRSLSIEDSLIAATALTHDLTVVTRNERDFAEFGVRVLNPWAA